MGYAVKAVSDEGCAICTYAFGWRDFCVPVCLDTIILLLTDLSMNTMRAPLQIF